MAAAEWTGAGVCRVQLSWGELGCAESSWWGSRGGRARGVAEGAGRRCGGCGTARGGTSRGRRRGPSVGGCSGASAGRALLALTSGGRAGAAAAATATAGSGVRQSAVERGSLHRGEWRGQGTWGGQVLPRMKPWGRSVSGGRGDGHREMEDKPCVINVDVDPLLLLSRRTPWWAACC